VDGFFSNIFPLQVGTKWLYRLEGRLFSKDIRLEIADKKNKDYLLKLSGKNVEGSIILKADVDLSVVGYSKKGLNTLVNCDDFEELQKIVILKSPVAAGTVWENNCGIFNIKDTNYTLKSGSRLIPGCVHLNLKDSSHADNDFYLKEGVGLIFASLSIDNVGKVSIGLKKFN